MNVTLEWLKEFVDIKLPPAKLAEVLTMGGLEVESFAPLGNDTVFELGVTPNRSDCLSVIGVARELAAQTKKKLHVKRIPALKGKGRVKDFLRVYVKSPSRCPRYSARVISGIKIGPSPAWIVQRLAACGVRPINNVVDATNYVMLERGQPLHAFDFRFIRGKKIVVSTAGKPFEFTTLDEEKRRIEPADLLICDGEGAIALAGIMGGKNSEVISTTTTVVLESAYFEPAGIRRTSRRLGLASESSRRFERGVDPNGTVEALNRLTQIICETAGGTPTADWVDIRAHNSRPCRIKLHAAEIKRTLGIDLSLAETRVLLKRLGIKAGTGSKNILDLWVPTYRPDITRPIDVIEEIARLHGYHRIASSMPRIRVSPLVKPRFAAKERAVRDVLIGCGLSEAVLPSFSGRGELTPFETLTLSPVLIENPIAQDQSVMRTMLLPGLLCAAKLNMSRQCKDVRFFALQRVFQKAGGAVEERLHLAGFMSGRRPYSSWDQTIRQTDFYDAKGAVEAVLEGMKLSHQSVWQRGETYDFLMPGRAADLLVGSKRIGFVGQLHPDMVRKWDLSGDCFAFELDFEALANASMAQRMKFAELSRFPFVERDIAVIVDDKIPSVEILKIIQNAGVAILDDVRIFDVYKGKGIENGKKSMAYTIRYASSEKTLTDEEVNQAHAHIIKMLEQKAGAVLRT
jgi:phenylalanyl-tRNA synthetase beta chain